MLITMDVVELKHSCIGLSAVNARMALEIS